MPEMTEVDRTVGELDELIEELGRSDPRLREGAESAIRLLLQLYGAALARAIEIVGPDTAAQLAEDKLLGSLLLLHGLHPVDAATRIGTALQRLERRLDGHRVRLVRISGDVATVRVEVDGGATPPSSLAAAIERAVVECAPEIAAVEVDGLPQPAVALVQIAPAMSH